MAAYANYKYRIETITIPKNEGAECKTLTNKRIVHVFSVNAIHGDVEMEVLTEQTN